MQKYGIKCGIIKIYILTLFSVKNRHKKREIKDMRTKGKSVKMSLMSLCMGNVVLACLIIGIVAIVSIRSTTNMAVEDYENAMNDGYNQEIKSQVQSVITILQAEYDKYESGELSEKEAKEEAAEIVRTMRYGDEGGGYFWIDDTDYNLVMHPILPDQEGDNRYELEDQNGIMIVQEIMKAAQSADGGGFNEFYFTKSDGVTVAPKVAYSEIFKPWGWVVSTGNYVDDMQAEMAAVKNDINDRFVQLCIIIAVVAVVMGVYSTIVSKIFGNSICAPLMKIQSLATRLSNGDLTQPVDVRDNNELGRTADALNVAQANMVELISNISTTSDNLAEAVRTFTKNFDTMEESIVNVSAAVGEIAQNTTTQAQSTTEAAESIESIAAGIETTSDEVGSLGDNAKTMQDYSDKSMDALQKLIEVNTKTKADIDSMYAQTKDTNDSVTKISQAATLITEISSQTNLLSLNASIEAARAGEAGKGFAVVAEEIGNLAMQSANTATEINDIIKELTDNSEKSMQIMRTMNEASTLQVNTLESTKEMFLGLKDALQECVNAVETMTERISAINAQRNKVTDDIETLNQLATDNAASTEETSAMSAELDGVVRQSADIVRTLLDDVQALEDNTKMFKL